MSHDLSVSVDDVERVFRYLMAHVREVVGPEASLDVDYFWAIPPDSLYDVYREPGELTVGQLTESWANLDGILRNPDTVITFALTWLADILRALGLTIVG